MQAEYPGKPVRINAGVARHGKAVKGIRVGALPTAEEVATANRDSNGRAAYMLTLDDYPNAPYWHEQGSRNGLWLRVVWHDGQAERQEIFAIRLEPSALHALQCDAERYHKRHWEEGT